MIQALLITWAIGMTLIISARMYKLAEIDHFESFSYPKRPVSNGDIALSVFFSLSILSGSAHYLLKLRVSALCMIGFCLVIGYIAWKRFRMHKRFDAVVLSLCLISITVYIALLMWDWSPLGL